MSAKKGLLRLFVDGTVDVPRFVAAWNASSSTTEVAQKLGITRSQTAHIASRMRDAGIDVPPFSLGRPRKRRRSILTETT